MWVLAPYLENSGFQASTYVLLDRVKDHAKNHADALVKSTLLTKIQKEEQAKMPESKQRIYSDSLNVVEVTAPADTDAVRFGDIAVREEWRSGLDKVFPDQKLESLVPSLISRELDDTNVSARTLENGGRRLVASKTLKEGDVVLKASCLLFTDMARVTEFLNTGGNSILLQGPIVRIDNLLDDTGSSRTLFALMLGAAMFIGDYRKAGGTP